MGNEKCYIVYLHLSKVKIKSGVKGFSGRAIIKTVNCQVQDQDQLRLSLNNSETESRSNLKNIKFFARPSLYFNYLASFVHCDNNQAVFFKKQESLLVKVCVREKKTKPNKKTLFLQTLARDQEKSKYNNNNKSKTGPSLRLEFHTAFNSLGI